MGSTPGLFVDLAGMQAAARALEATAGSVGDIARLRLGFGAAAAGRGYAADGALLRDALEALGGDLRAWVRSVSEIAAELHCSAQRYVEAEHMAASVQG